MNIIKNIKYHTKFLYRLLTAPKRKTPDFLIIGEAKCGTTSLFNYIKLNNEFEQPLTKEIHFFDYKFSKGFKWYKSHFPLLSKKK